MSKQKNRLLSRCELRQCFKDKDQFQCTHGGMRFRDVVGIVGETRTKEWSSDSIPASCRQIIRVGDSRELVGQYSGLRALFNWFLLRPGYGYDGLDNGDRASCSMNDPHISVYSKISFLAVNSL